MFAGQQRSRVGELARRVLRPETPARLRLRTAVVLATVVALSLASTVLMTRIGNQVRVIGDQAAPQAGAAAALYFALSDLDAQVARLALATDAGNRIDALGTYRERSRQIDGDLQLLIAGKADESATLALLDDLAVYRERVWQTLSTPQNEHGYYTQATNVLHQRLLPGAQQLRESSEDRLENAYTAKHRTQLWGVASIVVLGILLLILLLALQVWLTRRFHRVLNPALVLATVLLVVLVVPMILICVAQERRLSDARRQSLTPYLALSQARAISYDAAADTSRYLIDDKLQYYRDDFAAKSNCLIRGGSCGGGVAIDGGLSGVAGSPEVVTRWQAYQRDHERIVQLSAQGQGKEAITALTGIRRGDAAFDFSYYDDAVSRIASARERAFFAAVQRSQTLLSGWTIIPPAVLGLILLLVPLGVRPRMAEYQ